MKNTTNKQQLSLFVHTVDHEGRGIARDENNRVIFIENALPQSRVLAEIDVEKKNLAFAHTKDVLEASPYQVPAECPHTEHCGGCTWQELEYSQQLLYKKQILLDAFAKIAKIPLSEELTLHPATSLFRYRNKMEFAFGKDNNDRLILGLKSQKSHDIIRVSCLLCDKRVHSVISRLEELTQESKLPVFSIENDEASGFLRHAITRTSQKGDFVLEIITYPQPEYNQALYAISRELRTEFPFITGIVHTTRKNLLPLAFGEKTLAHFGSKDLSEKLNINGEELLLEYGHQSFFQVNTQASSALYTDIVNCISTLNIKTIADIYCGVGSIGLSIAKSLQKQDKNCFVYGLESIYQAVTYAQKNAEKLDIQAEFTHGNARTLSRFLKECEKIDLLILDPPRGGIEKESIQTLLRIPMPHILLISCNPATLARDMKLLKEKYEIKYIQAFDFFPHTPHIETCLLLSHKK